MFDENETYESFVNEKLLEGVDDKPEEQHLAYFRCPSCNAKFLSDKPDNTLTCPFCGKAELVLGGRYKNKIPDKIIPFSFDRSQAEKAFKDCVKGKLLLDKTFVASCEHMHAAYIPYYLFDVSIVGYKDVIKDHSVTYRNIRTPKFFGAQAEGNASFVNIPTNASGNVDDQYINSITPFNFDKAVDFSKDALSEYPAETPRGSEKYFWKAQINDAVTDFFSQELKHNLAQSNVAEAISTTNERYEISQDAASFYLVPIWFLHNVQQDENNLVIMNGQTGAIAGTLPVSKKRKYATLAGSFAVLMGIVVLILSLISWDAQSASYLGVIIFVAALISLLIAALITKGLSDPMTLNPKEIKIADYYDDFGLNITHSWCSEDAVETPEDVEQFMKYAATTGEYHDKAYHDEKFFKEQWTAVDERKQRQAEKNQEKIKEAEEGKEEKEDFSPNI